MTEEHALAVATTDGPIPAGTEADELERKLEKKRAKIRSAWISFVGRIVAQIMGAVATISLGLMLVQRYHAPVAAVSAPSPAEAVPLAAVPVRLVTPGETSIAVLPLRDVAGDGEASFARGMTEALITELVHLDEVRVVSRTSSAISYNDGRPLPEIARALAVDFIVDGSVIRADGRVRITARLIDGRRDEHVFAEFYDQPLRPVLSVQARVAGAIARAVKTALAAHSRSPAGIASQRKLELLPATLGPR
jgi:TolB-like protein